MIGKKLDLRRDAQLVALILVRAAHTPERAKTRLCALVKTTKAESTPRLGLTGLPRAKITTDTSDIIWPEISTMISMCLMFSDFTPSPKPQKSDRLKVQAEKREKRKADRLAEKRAQALNNRHGGIGHNSREWQPPSKTDGEREHLRRVKELPCICCNKFGPSDAHHVMSDRHGRPKASDYATIPLCKDCHQNGKYAFHNAKSKWENAHGKDWSFIPLVLKKLGIPTNCDFV